MPESFVLLESLPRAVLCSLAAWVLFYAPGRGLLGRCGSTLPLPFARILASTIVTTLVGTGLAAAGQFTLSSLLAINLAVALAGLLVRRALAPPPANLPFSRLDLAGPVIFAAAMLAYWPAYPAFLGASDSTAYVATGVSLAHHGTLFRDDDLGPQVPEKFRPVLFDSMSQVFGSTGPPYRRMPGGLLLESLDATKVWPAFFPVPSMWAAAFVLAQAPGGAEAEQAAPAYAPVFASLALWAFWLLARSWLSPGYAAVAVVLLGASAPFYTAARLPMSEPIAAFFSIAGLAVLAAGGPGVRDAMLAGAALGAAIFTRVETGMLLALAFALQPALAAQGETSPVAGDDDRRRLRTAFVVALLSVASLTAMQAAVVPGTWTLPLLDHLHNAWLYVILNLLTRGLGILAMATGAVVIVLMVFLARRIGWPALLRWSVLVGAVAGHAVASTYLAARTPMWLSFSIGWSGLVLSAVGFVVAWRDRARLPAAPLVLSLAAAVAVILFYNPHVYPSVPWGARRFVPLLLPLMVLLCCYVAARARSRSRVLSLACLALIAVPVFLGVRPIRGRTQWEGGYETLQQIDAAIPRDGTIFVDRDVSAMMVGPALWLIRDRNSITVPPTSGPGGPLYLPALVAEFARKGPVYLVTRAAGNQTRTARVRITLQSTIPVSLPMLEQTYDRPPRQMQRFLMPLAVYRLEPSPDPLGELPPTRMQRRF